MEWRRKSTEQEGEGLGEGGHHDAGAGLLHGEAHALGDRERRVEAVKGLHQNENVIHT